jgi:tetratricopeptide (TPR) repeat protein
MKAANCIFRSVLLVGITAACSSGYDGVFAPKTLERLQQVVDWIYRMQYADAASLCQKMIGEDPTDPAGYVYLARTYWIEALSSEQALTLERFAASDFFSELPGYKVVVDPALEARLRKASEEGIARAKQRIASNAGDLQALYLLGIAYQNLASFEASFKRNWWPAVQLGSKTDRYHREVLARSPDFSDAQLTVGVSHYLVGAVSWKVKWLSFLLGYHGDRRRAITEIEAVAHHGLLASDDARIVLTLAYTRERQDQKAFDTLSELHARFPENYLVPLAMGAVALRMNQPDRSAAIYLDLLQGYSIQKYSGLESSTVYNRLGVVSRVKGNLPAAIDWFRKTLDEASASNRSKTVARLEMGKTLDLMGRRSEALQQYRLVEGADDFAGSHLEARKLIARPFQP